MMTPLQKKFVELRLQGFGQKKAAVAAGYKEKSADKQASENRRNPKLLAYERALIREDPRLATLIPELLLLCLLDALEQCMQKKPVLEWDHGSRSWVESGSWQFDARGALRAIEILGKHLGMFTERVQVSGSIGSLESFLESFGPGLRVAGTEAPAKGA